MELICDPELHMLSPKLALYFLLQAVLSQQLCQAGTARKPT